MHEKPAETPKEKNTWKIAGVILIIAVFVLSAFAGFMVYKSLDQNSQIDNLNNKIKELESSNSDNNGSGNASDSGAAVTESYDEIIDQLRAVLPDEGNFDFGDTLTVNYQPSGYENLTTLVDPKDSPVGATNAMFYKTPTSGWQYFTSTQEELACSEFNTDDIRKSFATSTCFDVAGVNDYNNGITHVRDYFNI